MPGQGAVCAGSVHVQKLAGVRVPDLDLQRKERVRGRIGRGRLRNQRIGRRRRSNSLRRGTGRYIIPYRNQSTRALYFG